MARPPASPEQRQEQRDRIQRAAAELYREEGAMAVTARAVGKRAGVSTGTLYSYFANLEELMQSLWAGPVAAVGRQLGTIAAGHADPVDRIRAFLGAYVQFASDQPDVFRGAVLFVRPASAARPEVEPLDALPFFRYLLAAVEEGQRAGQLDAGDPRLMTQVLWAGIHGAVALPVNIDRYAVQHTHELAAAMIDSLIGCISQSADAVSP